MTTRVFTASSKPNVVPSKRSLSFDEREKFREGIRQNEGVTNQSAVDTRKRMKLMTSTHASATPDHAPLFDTQQLSPKKAIRAAFLKKRFAGTILKAQHIVHGHVITREKECYGNCAARVKIETETNSPKAATQRRQHDLIRIQRENARIAARIAIQKVVKTVEFDAENRGIMMDFYMLCESASSDDQVGLLSLDISSTSPLEWIGLVRKDEDFRENNDEDMIWNGDYEEGEIVP